MRLLEIERQLQRRRKFKDGDYSVTVKLENPGSEFQELLRVKATKDGEEAAKALFKQWEIGGKWEPLNISIADQPHKKILRDLIYSAARNAGFNLRD